MLPHQSILATADATWPEQLAALADLEERSRSKAEEEFAAASADLTAAITTVSGLWDEVHHEARRIAIRLWPDEYRELLASTTIENVALCHHPHVAELLLPSTRMYLGRAWRAWIAELVVVATS